MKEIEKLGNIEFCDCFLTLHEIVYNFYFVYKMKCKYYDFDKDPRTSIGKNKLSKLLETTTMSKDLYLDLINKAQSIGFGIDLLNEREKYCIAMFMAFLNEAKKRGLIINKSPNHDECTIDDIFWYVHSKDFDEWRWQMQQTPTYIYESLPSNEIGARNGNYYEEIDYPVREACKILNSKGYETYWSSANISDFRSRNGDVIKGKNVAYILISPYCLPQGQKEELLLNGTCKFWGVATTRGDNGKYYGIWAEITSSDMLCDDISKILVQKALDLPNLKEEIQNKR